MIELTSAYIHTTSKVLINPRFIIYVQASKNDHPSYDGVQAYVEYAGGQENQVLYTKESYEQIKELLNDYYLRRG